MTTRESEEFKEMCRKDITKDVKKHIKANPSYRVARFVDQDVLEHTVLSQYGRFKSAMHKVDYDERVWSQKGSQQQNILGDKVNMMAVPLNMSVEEAYFNTFGKGLNGEEAPSPMHQRVYCPHCHVPFWGDPASMELFCPRCHHKTQWGELVLDAHILSK